MTKLAVAYWILVNVIGSPSNPDFPIAMGPYPSLELCQVAGHNRFPEDTRFWTVEQIAAEKERLAQADARRKKELLTAPHDKRGWATLSDGFRAHFNRDGKQDATDDPSYSRMFTCPCYSAISACAKVSETK